MVVLITVVGGGGSYPPPGYGGPSILIDLENSKILLDCGEDCLTGLALAGYSPCDVDLVYISHIHIDHWSGLASLGIAKIAESCPELKIVAEDPVLADLKPYIQKFIAKSVKIETIPVRNLQLHGYKLRTYRANHPPPTYGITLMRGETKLVTYTSDTKLALEIVKEVYGAHLLIAEATLPSSLSKTADESGHLTVSDFLELTRDANPRYAIAIHLSPESLEELRRRILAGEAPSGVLIGSRGLQLSIHE